MATALHPMLWGAISVALLMLVLWLVHLPMKNAGIVDVGWAGGLALLAVIYALAGTGYAPRIALMATMAVAWGLRLSLYILLTRVIGKPEDGRYQQLRKEWTGNTALRFLLFFEFQALLCIVLSVPFLVAALNSHPHLAVLEYAGAGLWLIAFAGECAADFQLHAFKANPANKGKTCHVGLWRYSRHPNYFFEWLIWMAFSVFALPSPGGYLGLLSPALILYFLFKVTGIPATEAQALRTKGEEYRQYQQTTSAFVPWFPKR